VRTIENLLIYPLIFIAVTVEISLRVIRIVLITKGYKELGSVIAFFQMLLWVFIVSNILQSVAQDPLRGVVYALGFSAGIYVGSRLEERLGLGFKEIRVILKENTGAMLIDHLRAHGYAITVEKAEGRDLSKDVLTIYAKRKEVKKIIKIIMDEQSDVVITSSNIVPIYGGFKL
jgi:uncharacterized protein YebE (UPF0316 family)